MKRLSAILLVIIKKSKSILALLLAIVICISTFPTQTFAESKYDVINANLISGTDIVTKARQYIGTPYSYSDDYNTRTGYGSTMMFDCSGLVYRVCREVGLASSRENYSEGQDSNGNYYITAHTWEQRFYGESLSSQVNSIKAGDYSGLLPGDLIFIDYGGDGITDHVGIYSGDGKYINAQCGGVMEEPLTNDSGMGGSWRSFVFDACRLVKSDASSYPCYIAVKMTDSCYSHESYYEASTQVTALREGQLLAVDKIIKNKYGNYWYRLKKDGSYIYAGKTEPYWPENTCTISYTGLKLPTSIKQGDGFYIEGVITPQKDYRIVQVKGVIHESGNRLYESDDYGSYTSYNLYKSKVDNGLLYSKLSAGSYTTVIEVTTSTYYSDGKQLLTREKTEVPSDMWQDFTVTEKSSSGGSSTSSSVVMTAGEFVTYLEKANARTDSMYTAYLSELGDEQWKACFGYYNGTYIYWDCWNLGKTILWSRGSIVDNKTVGNYASPDSSFGLPDASGTWILNQCTEYSSDFSTIYPGEWLFHGSKDSIDHVGYYVGNNQVIQIGVSGQGIQKGTLNTSYWSYHAKVPWIDYTSVTQHSHSYTEKTVAPTCTTSGYTEYTCSCGESYKGKYVSATGHTWDNGTVTKAATCAEEGIKTYKCSVCGETKTEAIEKTEHKYVSKTFAGDCCNPGKTVYTCSECGDSYEEITADWSDWTTVEPEGVGENFIETATQYRIRTKETATSEASTLVGYTADGSHTEYSSWSDWSEWSQNAVTASDACQVETCTGYGWYYFKCSNCGAHMHGYGTCWTWCGGCGAATYSSNFNQMYDVTNWDVATDWHGTTKYSAIINGERWFRWDDGGTTTLYRSRTRTEKTVYDFYRWSDWSDWDFEEAEADDNRQVETRTVYRTNSLTGEHKWDSGTVTKAATCVATGVKTYTCSACGETKTETVPVTGHTPGKAVRENEVEATPEHSGSYDEVVYCSCEDCKAELSRKTVTVEYTNIVDSGTCGEALNWSLDRDDVLTISGTGNMTNYDASSIINAAPWDNQWNKKNPIKKLIIEDGVTGIGNCAFYWQPELSEVSIPDSVTSIGEGAFFYCKAITTIKLPGGLKKIGNSAFSNCTGLTKLTLPDSVVTIGEKAFKYCDALTCVTIPAGIVSIGENAFAECTKLTDVYYGGTESQWKALNVQDSVLLAANIHYNGEVPHTHTYGTPTYSWNADHSACTATRNCTGSDCTESEKVTATITSSITKAATCTVAGEKTYTAKFGVSWASTQTYKETIAAKGHTPGTAVKENEVEATAEHSGSYDEVIYCTVCEAELSRKTVTVEYSNVLASGTCGTNLTWTLDKDGLLTISGTGNMSSYSASSRAPWYDLRDSVKEVKILDGATDIGNYAFSGCSSLALVTIPSSVKMIRSCAFQGTGITSLTIPSSVTSIGEDAFYGCKSLTDITIPGNVTTIGYAAFAKCTNLKNLTLSDGITRIYGSAFLGCSNLTHVTIPESVTMLDSGCFKECTSLTSITIPKGVTNISSTFYGCTSLKSVTISKGVKNINGYTFYGCTALTDISIPTSITTIKDNAFTGCTSLANISIPSSVTSIGSTAFSNCTALTDVYYGGTEAQWMALNVQDSVLLAATIHFAGEEEHTHTYGTPTYAWNSDHSACTATRSCTSSGCNASETATATVTNSVTKSATCTATGEKTYTAVFTASWASTQTYKETIAATGHAWDSGTVTTAATVDAEGVKTYHCTHSGCTATKTEAIPKLTPEPDPDAKQMTISVGTVQSGAGKTVKVPVNFDINPGVAMFEFTVNYDSTVLTLDAIEPVISGDFTSNVSTGKIIWVNDSDDSTVGTVLELTFTVSENAEEGISSITLSGEAAANLNEDACSVTVTGGGVNIVNRTPGDVTGDGKVNGMDLLRLKKYLVGMDVTIEESNADVTGDGKVNGMDLLRLKKYLVGMDVELK